MITNCISGNVQQATLGWILKEFPTLQWQRIKKLLSNEGVEGLVYYENLQLDSHELGDHTVAVFGPSCTVHTLNQAAKVRLGDVPSRFQYATRYLLNEVA